MQKHLEKFKDILSIKQIKINLQQYSLLGILRKKTTLITNSNDDTNGLLLLKCGVDFASNFEINTNKNNLVQDLWFAAIDSEANNIVYLTETDDFEYAVLIIDNYSIKSLLDERTFEDQNMVKRRNINTQKLTKGVHR